jgi:hypothetical protein
MADPKKKDELDETLGLDEKEKPEHNLEDVDPLFKEGTSAKPKEHSDKPINTEPNTYVGEGAVTGAVLGFGANRVLPPTTAAAPKGLDTAKVNAEVTQKSAQRQQQNLTSAKTAQTSLVDSAFKDMNVAKSTADQAAQKLADARAYALKLNALPEPPPVEVPKVGSTIPIDEGAMRHNVKMGNIVDYNAVRKGMTGTTDATQGMGRLSGYTQTGRLIVPSELANAPIYNAEQLLAQKQLAEAEAAYAKAQAHANSMQAKWQGLTKSTPKAVTTAQANVVRATEKAASAADKLKALEAAKPTGLQRAGAIVSKIPGLNILSGALTGAEAVNAYEQAQRGEYLDATMSGLGATGGALMMVPHPLAKIGGALLSAPPLIYQGYQYFKNSGDKPNFDTAPTGM